MKIINNSSVFLDLIVVLNHIRPAQSYTDLGLVPLLHLYGRYFFNKRVSATLDIEGAGASQGRAINAAVKAAYYVVSSI